MSWNFFFEKLAQSFSSLSVVSYVAGGICKRLSSGIDTMALVWNVTRWSHDQHDDLAAAPTCTTLQRGAKR